MTKDKERDDALIAEALMGVVNATRAYLPPDGIDEKTCINRILEATDNPEMARIIQRIEERQPKPDRAEALAWMIEGLFAEAADNPCTCASDENSCPHCNAWERATKQTRACIVEVIDELRAEWEAERLEIPTHKHYSTPLIERLNGPHEWGYRDPVEGGFIADMSPFEASDRLSELEAERPAVVVPSEDQIKHMTNRFLGWRLPEDFRPDDGISFEPEFNKEWNASQGKPPQRRTPTGTNLFSYTQAEAMVRYMLGDGT
jgi:glutaredoxin